MTATDKTGEKLVDSMRKTKAAAASDQSGASRSGAQASPKQDAQPPSSKKKTTTGRSSGRAGARRGDPYQSGRRIWPD